MRRVGKEWKRDSREVIANRRLQLPGDGELYQKTGAGLTFRKAACPVRGEVVAMNWRALNGKLW